MSYSVRFSMIKKRYISTTSRKVGYLDYRGFFLHFLHLSPAWSCFFTLSSTPMPRKSLYFAFLLYIVKLYYASNIKQHFPASASTNNTSSTFTLLFITRTVPVVFKSLTVIKGLEFESQLCNEGYPALPNL